MTNHPFFNGCWSIQPQVPVAVVVEKHLKDVQHLRHLSENKDPMLLAPEATQEYVQDLEFACVTCWLV